MFGEIQFGNLQYLGLLETSNKSKVDLFGALWSSKARFLRIRSVEILDTNIFGNSLFFVRFSACESLESAP